MSKKISFFDSVQAKIIITTVVAVTSILAVYGVWEFGRQADKMISELSDLSEVTTERLTNNLLEPLWDLDFDLVERTIAAEMLSKDVLSVIVVDADGRSVFSGKARDANWNVINVTEVIRGASNTISNSSKIIGNEGQAFGSVFVVVSKELKEKELSLYMFSFLGLLLFLGVVMVLVLTIVIRINLIGPIIALGEIAEQISYGNFSDIDEADRKDEIGVVAKSIKRVQTSLQLAIKRLKIITVRNQTLQTTIQQKK